MRNKNSVPSERNDRNSAQQWLRWFLVANGVVAMVIAAFHFYWPGHFERVGEFAPLDEAHRQFVYLATSAIGLLLTFVAILAFYSAATVRSATRGAVFVGFALAVLFGARAGLGLIYPVRVPLFGLEDPTPATIVGLGVLGLATWVVVARARRAALGLPAVRRVPVPDRTLEAGHLRVVDYADTYRVELPATGQEELLAFAREVFCRVPGWVLGLLWLRDRIVTPFGLKTGKEFQDAATDDRLGGHVGLQVLSIHDDEIILGEADKHLTFRVCILRQGAAVLVTTLVEFHNRLGRLYFVPVGPAHRVVVVAMIRRAAQRLWQAAG